MTAGQEFWRRAEAVIAGGVNSPARSFRPRALVKLVAHRQKYRERQ